MRALVPHTSTENQVVIRNVDFQLTGNFSCETTTDSESFYTQKSSKFLTVVSIPKDKPVIMSERAHYSPGDTLKANCSTTPSRPSVTLSFTLNGAQNGCMREGRGSVYHLKSYSPKNQYPLDFDTPRALAYSIKAVPIHEHRYFVGDVQCSDLSLGFSRRYLLRLERGGGAGESVGA
ncbi:uncharacterized protein LOC106647466 [Copidosoma floridanum]|uniref:uncharacterized protein LOC106647466 n=1 Tax=Copidosoma floridanum TaxID=29053 RepID=UPI0006C9DEEC|nr:uncharacterized protein LOC106647466 [Copidosoma floridanum]